MCARTAKLNAARLWHMVIYYGLDQVYVLVPKEYQKDQRQGGRDQCLLAKPELRRGDLHLPWWVPKLHRHASSPTLHFMSPLQWQWWVSDLVAAQRSPEAKWVGYNPNKSYFTPNLVQFSSWSCFKATCNVPQCSFRLHFNAIYQAYIF